MDDGRMVIYYFLSNASQWKGELAKKIKAELKKRVKAKSGRNESIDHTGKKLTETRFQFLYGTDGYKKGDIIEADVVGENSLEWKLRILNTNDVIEIMKDDVKMLRTEQKEVNKKTLQLAESIRAQRQIEIQNGVFGFRDNEKLKASFIAYFEILTNKRFDSQGNYGNWDSTLKHLRNFAPNGITFGQLDIHLVQDFREYLDKGKITKGGAKLSQNSKHSYFAKFKAAIKQAYKDGYLTSNPAEKVDGIKEGEPEREFLKEFHSYEFAPEVEWAAYIKDFNVGGKLGRVENNATARKYFADNDILVTNDF
jgi:hypothetical protein